VSASTVLKSKKSAANGTNKTEDPKPDTVPAISANKASSKKYMYDDVIVPEWLAYVIF
jgi:hypothetical protein